MNTETQRRREEDLHVRRARFAVLVVAAATFLNSLILQFGHYQDLYVGLCGTQVLDAVAMGLNSIEPQGSPTQFIYSRVAFVVDCVIVTFLMLLAAGIQRRKSRALVIAVVLYGMDLLISVIFAVLNGIGRVGNRDIRGVLAAGLHVAVLYLLIRGLRSIHKTSNPAAGLAPA